MINVEVMCQAPNASGILAKAKASEPEKYVRINADELDELLARAGRSTDWFKVAAVECKFAKGNPYTVVMSEWATDASEEHWLKPYKLYADVLAQAVVEYLVDAGSYDEYGRDGDLLQLLDEFDIASIVSRVCEHYETGKPLDECGY